MKKNFIHDSAIIGEFVVIEDGVYIGENVSIGNNSVIKKGTYIDDNVIIGSHCVLGIQPKGNQNMRRSNSTSQKLMVSSGVIIGNFVSIYLGTSISEDIFIGDYAGIRENVSIGQKTVIGRSVVIELNSSIGRNCVIQTQAYITGDTTIEDNVFIGPCVSMSNDKYMGAKEFSLIGPYIKEGSKIGNNASLLPGVIIGTNTIVGAGSVVTKNTGDNVTVIGVPAKVIKNNGKNEGLH